MKDELRGKIRTEFVLRPKGYSYLTDDGNSHKKAKGTKKCVPRLKFNDDKDCLLNNEIILKSQQRLKVKPMMHILNNQQSAGKVCKTEMLSKVNVNN